MFILHFIGSHWLLIGLTVLAIALVAALPAQALLLGRWLVGTKDGRILIASVIAAVLLWFVLIAVGNHYKAIGAEAQRQTDAKVIADKSAALVDAAYALRGAAAALDQVNAAAEKAIADAKQAQADADSAGEVALEAQNAAQLRMKAYDRDLQRARANPTCDALLNANVATVCGL